MADNVEMKESAASKRGMCYRGPNGSKIPNLGEKEIIGYNANGEITKKMWQMANVKRPLDSVIELVKEGNRVVFDQSNGVNISDITHKATGKTIPINEVNGAYEYDLWIKKIEKNQRKIESNNVELKNMYNELADQDDDAAEDFLRLV